MDHIKQTNPTNIAGPVYHHPYGGFARDILVGRDGFARFFKRSPEYIDMLPCNQKIFNVFDEGCEMIGMKLLHHRFDKVQYVITFIEHREGSLAKILADSLMHSISSYLKHPSQSMGR